MAETDLKILEEELTKIHPAELARGRRKARDQSAIKPKQSLELICTGNPKSGNIKPIMNDALVVKMRTMSREQVRELLTQLLPN